MVDAERGGELRVAFDVVGPLRPCGTALAITIARFENQHVFANSRVHEHRAGEHRATVPTATAIAVEFEVAFLQTERADQLPYHLAFRLPVVERNHAIDVLDLQPGIRDRLEACLGGEAQGRDSRFTRERGPANPDDRSFVFERLLRHGYLSVLYVCSSNCLYLCVGHFELSEKS